MIRFFKIFSLVFLVHLSYFSFAQQINIVSKGNNSSPSYYDIIKINSNSFLAGGEEGTLTTIDTLGNKSTIAEFSRSSDILKLLKVNQLIYIALSNGELIEYDLQNKQIIREFKFDFLEQKCIYDMKQSGNNKLLIVGGSNKVAKGKIGIPGGFVAEINLSQNSSSNIIYKNAFTYAWSVCKSDQNQNYVSIYNIISRKSKVYLTDTGIDLFQKKSQTRGIIHHITNHNNNILYSGTKNLLYTKNGIWGQTNNGYKTILKNSGAAFSIIEFNNQLFTANYDGSLTMIDTRNNDSKLEFNNNYPIYELIKLTPTKLCFIGHGNLIGILSISGEQQEISGAKTSRQIY